MLKLLGIAWSAWKVATKRFGPLGGFVVAVAVVAGYTFVVRWLRENYPELAAEVE